ncbi:NAD(P)-binding protein [Leptospira levettii]|uniref:NAD(P)-binding protein n=1 Tax=Leptospira levettii TaxID=2023178 RepID=A0AAW5VDF1_9LEPT|nr:NAD(P)-binding protein [Leptospira levettii]MCW7466185.1 NAD(P)-binding protein [Leptospira levettii]MCW7512290.1 NAD(P)-binding protein [Leptospira levettii]MCW7516298.1 NAD(P)-binding protein [Leptospira levettii]
MSKLVVGGGIAGIYSAILLRKKGYDVTLIERADKLGGLLNSFENEYGDIFDLGTHFIAGTGKPEIDEDVIPRVWQNDWNKYENERAANFFAGSLDDKCIFLDSNKLGKDVHNQGFVEILNLLDLKGQPDSQNAKENLENLYGKTLTEKLFGPILTKLYGESDLTKLDRNAQIRFAMRRILVSTPEITKKLKTIPELDSRIGFHHYLEGASSNHQYYPKSGGAGDWIQKFEKRLDELGVKTIKNTAIESITVSEKKITSVKLSSGQTIDDIDEVVWTIPTHLLLNTLKLEYPKQLPKFRKTIITYFVFDKKPKNQSHFIFCYDPSFLSFRITTYSNWQPDQAERTNRHRVCIETLTDHSFDTTGLEDKLKDELIRMGIIEPDSNILYQNTMISPSGFPVMDDRYYQNVESIKSILFQNVENVKLLGKDSSNAWFMIDVFNEIYQNLNK